MERWSRLERTEAAPGRGDSSSVGQHAQTTADLGEITTRDTRSGLMADTELESGRTPIHNLNRLPSLDGSDRRLDILRNDIAAVE